MNDGFRTVYGGTQPFLKHGFYKSLYCFELVADIFTGNGKILGPNGSLQSSESCIDAGKLRPYSSKTGHECTIL